ncbi:MAG: hypothetical protein ACK4ZN_01890 [Oceanibaculum sp.]
MDTVPLWVTLIGFAAPLIALAGSAVAFVARQYQEAAVRRRNQFFELMEFIDAHKTIARKMAAVYRLRDFPEHADFIIRFCDVQRSNIDGPGAGILQLEMDETKNFMKSYIDKEKRKSVS